MSTHQANNPSTPVEELQLAARLAEAFQGRTKASSTRVLQALSSALGIRNLVPSGVGAIAPVRRGPVNPTGKSQRVRGPPQASPIRKDGEVEKLATERGEILTKLKVLPKESTEAETLRSQMREKEELIKRRKLAIAGSAPSAAPSAPTSPPPSARKLGMGGMPVEDVQMGERK